MSNSVFFWNLIFIQCFSMFSARNLAGWEWPQKFFLPFYLQKISQFYALSISCWDVRCLPHVTIVVAKIHNIPWFIYPNKCPIKWTKCHENVVSIAVSCKEVTLLHIRKLPWNTYLGNRGINPKTKRIQILYNH